MTSNVGTRQLKDFGKGVGFNTSESPEMDAEYSQGVIQKALSRTFAPEFLNRIDEVVMFNPLNKESIKLIIDLELKDVYNRVKEMGYQLELTPAAKDFIAERGYDAQFGVRPLKRAIQKYIEGQLADIVLSGEIHPGNTILMDIDTENNTIKPKIIESTPIINN